MRLALIVLCLILFLFGCDSNDISVEEEAEEESSVVVITEEDIRICEREIARGRAEENLSKEEIREEAIERAIKRAVADNYFEKKGITVSEEEIDETLSLHILEEEGVETKEEYFDLMARRGFSEEEIKRNIIRDIKMNKVLELILEETEVTEEEALDYYRYQKEKAEEEGNSLPPFSEIEDNIVEEVTLIFALEQMIEDIKEERENAQIEILE